MPINILQEHEEAALLSFDGVRAWYNPADPVLESGSLVVPHNVTIGLVGKNGTGKTTLIKSLCGVHQQASFEGLSFEGTPCSPQDIRFKLSRYACFAQDRSFRYWNLDKLIEFVRHSFSSARDETYRGMLLEGFGLTEVCHNRLGDLSDGQRKKAALCSAFYARRPLLLLDEPVDFLDFSSTEFLYETIGSYTSTHGSIVLCSHVAESLTRCCEYLYSLDNGVIAGPFAVPENPEDVSRVLAR